MYYCRVRDQVVNKPGFLVKAENEKHISIMILLKKRSVRELENKKMKKRCM